MQREGNRGERQSIGDEATSENSPALRTRDEICDRHFTSFSEHKEIEHF